MSRDEFTRLFDYMEQRFDAIEQRCNENNQGHVQMYAVMADFGVQLKDVRDELIIYSSELSLHNKWIKRIAGTISVEF